MSDTDTADAGAKPIHVATAAELDALVAEHDRLLVEFHTEGCAACAAMEPVLGTVARVVDVPVVTLNPRDDPQLVERYRIQSVPTLLSFEDGEVVDRLAEGFVGVDRVVEFVESVESVESVEEGA